MKIAFTTRRGLWNRTRIASTAECTHRHDLLRSRRTTIHFRRVLRAELKPRAKLPRAPSFCNRLHINRARSQRSALETGYAGPACRAEHGDHKWAGHPQISQRDTALVWHYRCTPLPLFCANTSFRPPHLTFSPPSSGPREIADSILNKSSISWLLFSIFSENTVYRTGQLT